MCGREMAKRGRSRRRRQQSERETQSIWIKDKEQDRFLPLPEDAEYISYYELHATALDQRQRAVRGHTPYDLIVLYNFWSHFLIRNFNTNMYMEFHRLAHEDASKSSNVGMERLLRYYQEALSSHTTIRDRVAQDYIMLAAQGVTDPENNGSALKSLLSAWRNGAMIAKNREKIYDLMSHELRAELDGS